MSTHVDRQVEIVKSDGTPVDGATTIADGADVAEGHTTDTAITSDSNGTIIGFLRGLIKILADVWNSGSHYLTVGLATALNEATDSVSGHVGGYSKVVNLLLTRPSNTTPYSIGDEIADNAGTPAQRSFVGAARVNGGSGVMTGCTMIFSDNPTITPTLKLYVFDVDPTSAGDNNVFAPTDAQMANCLGVMTFSTAEVGLTGTTGNMMMDSGPVSIPYTCAGGSTTLYFLLVTRTAFTSGASSSTITLRGRFEQN